MEENEKELHKKVERLYELATELKAEADKTDSTKVLSLNLVKKAEEIEKLAHDIKIRSKG
jgi:heme oxygenase